VETVRLKIDGRSCQASLGKTILDVAEENGIEIPSLCHLKGLTDVGVCRVCIVDVYGQLVPACTTVVADGMEIQTSTDTVLAYRRSIVELLFAEGSHVCAFCVSNGDCELQDLACDVGMDSVRVPYVFPRNRVDASHPRFLIDRDRCVLCGRCVRACAEVEGAHTWDFAERGSAVRVIADLDVDWGKAETCTGCGKCVEVCPTGAIARKGASNAEMRKKPEVVAGLVERRGHG
jgi:bidirectional [NiFe] hydrogenase diaphorase subunit